ncbi:MAG: GNAT family N-acetyltransferase [Verrucomicrobiales bacterium]
MIRRLWAHLADRLNRSAAPAAGGASPAAAPLAAPTPTPPPGPDQSSKLPERLGSFTLRRASTSPADSDLLLAAFASGCEADPDLNARHPDSRQAIVTHAFASRQISYPVDFPGVEFFLLELGGAPAGRLYLQLTEARWFIVDLVLLPHCRGRGHGTALLSDLIRQAEAAQRPVHLHVAKSNTRAAALYHRLGFRRVHELPRHYMLARNSTRNP